MGNSAYLRELIMRRVFLDADALPGLWVSLHSADPGESGAGELRDYARQAVAFGAGEAGAVVNRSALQYDNLPAATLTHFGVWDAERGGHYLTGGALDLGLIVPKGKSLRWRENELTLIFP